MGSNRGEYFAYISRNMRRSQQTTILGEACVTVGGRNPLLKMLDKDSDCACFAFELLRQFELDGGAGYKMLDTKMKGPLSFPNGPVDFSLVLTTATPFSHLSGNLQ